LPSAKSTEAEPGMRSGAEGARTIRESRISQKNRGSRDGD